MLKLDIQLFASENKLVIGIEADTKSFETQIEQTEEYLERLEETYAQMLKGKKDEGLSVNEQSLKNIEAEIEKTTNKLVDLQAKQDKLEGSRFDGMKESLKDVGKTVDSVGKGLTKIVGKVGRWALAIFGIRSMFSLVRNAVNEITQENSQLGVNIEYIKWVLIQTIKPVVEWFIKALNTIIMLINTALQSLFGFNLFSGKSVDDFNKMKKGVGGVASGLKEAKKQLAGFDEMNVLQDNSSSGGGGGSVGTDIPNVDFSKILDLSNFHPLEWLKGKLRELLDYIYSIDWYQLGKDIYQKIKDFFSKIDLSEIVSTIFELNGAVLGSIGSFLIGFLEDAWEDIKDYFKTWIEDAEENGGSVAEGILNGILNIFSSIGIWIADNIFTPFIDGFKNAFDIHSPSHVMEGLGEDLINGLKEGLLGIWDKVKSIFDGFKENIIKVFSFIWSKIKEIFAPVVDWFKEKFSKAWENIKNVFSTVGTFFGNVWNTIKSKFTDIGQRIGDAVGGAFKKAFNAVMSSVENVVNTPIRAINNLIGTVNKLTGAGFGKLSTFSLPRLARGGIVNNPGPGIMMGSYIAGEKGAEAVLPLTDGTLQKLANMMPITVHVTNTMNGRVLSREIQRVQNETDFAFNG